MSVETVSVQKIPYGLRHCIECGCENISYRRCKPCQMEKDAKRLSKAAMRAKYGSEWTDKDRVVRPPEKGLWVYFAYANISNLVKIGVSKNVPNRIKELQVGSPERLKLMLSVEETVLGYSEPQLHEKFADLREHGEWFRFESPFREFVLSAARSPSVVNQYGPDLAKV